MSFTGGYDLCIELGDQELTARATASLAALAGGSNIERDVELNHPAGGVLLRGNVHVFVTSLQMRSVESADAEVDVVLRFERSALRLDGPIAGTLDDLSGEVTVRGVAVTVLDRSDPVTLIFDFSNARSAVVGFRDADASRVNDLLAGAGLDETAIIDVLAEAALDNVQMLGGFIVTTPLRRTSDMQDGDLAGLRFVEVDVRTRALPDGSGGALCLFGTLLQSSLTRTRNRSGKSQVGLRRGATSAVALDEAAVRPLVFCPGAFGSLLPRWLDAMLGDGFLRDLPDDAFMHRSEKTQEAIREAIDTADSAGERRDAYALILGDDPTRFERRIGPTMWSALPDRVREVLARSDGGADVVLPPPCGHGGVPIGGDARLAELDLVLGDGIATLVGHAFSTSPFADGRIDFRHDVRLAVAERTRNGITTTELDLASVGQATVVTDLAPSYLAIELAVLTLGLFLAGVYARIDDAPATTRSALRAAVNAFAAPDLPADLGAVSAATIRPEAIVVSFLARATAARFAVTFPSLGIGRTETRTRGTVGPRTAMRVDDRCHHGDYHYRDVELTTEWTLEPAPTELDAPLRTTWILAGRELADGDGFLALRDGSRLHYVVAAGGASLVVRNDPGSDDAVVTVACRAVDKYGLRATAPPISLRFVGTSREWEDPYNAEAHDCIERSIGEFGNTVSERPQPARGVGPVSIDRLRRASIRDGVINPVVLRSLSARLRGNTAIAALAARSTVRGGGQRGPG